MIDYVFLGIGALFTAFPNLVHIFMHTPFVGHEEALVRLLGLTLAVVGWRYLFRDADG
jgi:hypothetical protein